MMGGMTKRAGEPRVRSPGLVKQPRCVFSVQIASRPTPRQSLPPQDLVGECHCRGGVTAEPIPFSNAILFVKGSRQGTQSSGFPTITTGNGCGQNDTFPPCDLIFEGGPARPASDWRPAHCKTT